MRHRSPPLLFPAAIFALALALVGAGRAAAGGEGRAAGFLTAAMRASPAICPGRSLEFLASRLFVAPRWYAGTTGEGRSLVNVSGTIAGRNPEGVVARIQYLFDERAASLSFHGMDYAGIRQSEGRFLHLAKRACAP